MQYVHQQITLPLPDSDSPDVDAAKITCLVTGENKFPARLHEPKIKGVVGAQSAGALLVSFNADAFTSYGKEQSYNAPVGEETVFKYVNALNQLLADRRISLGDTTAVYWADQHTPVEDALALLFSGESSETEEQKPEEDREARAAQVVGDDEPHRVRLGLRGG